MSEKPAATAEVTVGLPVRGAFHYAIPVELAERVARGSVVAVPFRRRIVPGFVTAIGTSPPAGVVELKAIARVLEAGEALPAELLRLAEEAASYYLAGLGELLMSAVPVARITTRTRTIERDGVAVEELAARPAVARKSERWLRLRPGVDLEHPALARGKRARALVAWLGERQGAGTWVAGRAATGADTTVLRGLEERGLLTVEDVEISRDLVVPGATSHRNRDHELTAAQREAIERIGTVIGQRRFEPFLLHGVTGSGKTLVYLECIAIAHALGLSSLILVPEIALTPALARELRGRFGEAVAVLHSALPPGERHDAWRRVRAGHARVVFGARSAVFAPIQELGLVVVDEEHDPSYKQDDRPHYHARDVAVLRAKLAGVPVVLGSATPSLESFENARSGRYTLLELRGRSTGQSLPEVEVIDLREDFDREGTNLILSARLAEALTQRLAAGEQSILLLNRRGWASFLLCRECGSRAECPNCSVALTFHRGEALLKCHHCDFRRQAQRECHVCGGTFLNLVGHGTEKVEHAVREAVPGARVLRLDRDAARRRDDVVEVLERFESGGADILVGTQMVAKGHDFPNVTLVGVVSVDAMLALPDFRTAERTFALLTQVAGRAGRGERKGQVLLQTYYPDNEAVKLACAQDYAGFFAREIRLRRALRYPPVAFLAQILIRGRDRKRTMEQAKEAAQALGSARTAGVVVRGPALAPVERKQRDWRWQILLKSASRRGLRATLEGAQGVLRPLVERGILDLDIDPHDLL